MHGERTAFEGSVGEDAAPSRRALKHPNAGKLHPLWAGEGCDGLTAVYAVVNGIRLALAHRHRFTSSEVQKLLAAGLHFYEGRLGVRQCVLGGVRVQHWRALVGAMGEATGRIIGERVLVEPLTGRPSSDRDHTFSVLDDAIGRLRVPLMLLRGGAYTVVSGTTPASILLFDSRGYSWISKRACGVSGDAENVRHMIVPSALLALNT